MDTIHWHRHGEKNSCGALALCLFVRAALPAHSLSTHIAAGASLTRERNARERAAPAAAEVQWP